MKYDLDGINAQIYEVVLCKSSKSYYWVTNFYVRWKKYCNMKRNVMYLDETWDDRYINFHKYSLSSDVIGAKCSVDSVNRCISVHVGGQTSSLRMCCALKL